MPQPYGGILAGLRLRALTLRRDTSRLKGRAFLCRLLQEAARESRPPARTYPRNTPACVPCGVGRTEAVRIDRRYALAAKTTVI